MRLTDGAALLESFLPPELSVVPLRRLEVLLLGRVLRLLLAEVLAQALLEALRPL